MTYVEFFSHTALDNVCSCLAQEPDKIIYIGRNKYRMKEFIQLCSPVFENEIEFDYRVVDLVHLNSIVDTLADIVENEPECAFDLTGGPDLALVAMGIIAERYKDRPIQMHRFSIAGGNALDCDEDGVTLEPRKPASLTVDQLLRLHGGALAKDWMTEVWTLDSRLNAAISVLWDQVKNNPGFWNLNSSFLGTADSMCDAEEGTDTKVVTPFDAFPNPSELTSSIDRVIHLLRRLKESGLVTDYSVASSPFTVEYADSQIRRLVSKAGNILELKVYEAAVSARDKAGNPIYQDCVNGAVIDWAGNDEADHTDPINEIDLILMKGLQPVFISCKNGMFGAEELFKFNSVTERYGGKYAKKVLISTRPVNDPDLKFRAQELGIRLVDNVMSMTDKQFRKRIASLYSL